MWAVVGLGNPGPDYEDTRHNVGFMVVRRLAGEWDVRLKKRKYLARTAETDRVGETVLLALPQTYMNRSGRSARSILEGAGLPPERLIVVYDDLDIRLGGIRIRKDGRPGTHKGMQSIVDEIGTTRFPRIRVGIGPLPPGEDAAEYVLSPFGDEERPALEASLKKAGEALSLVLAGEMERAMTAFNQKTGDD